MRIGARVGLLAVLLLPACGKAPGTPLEKYHGTMSSGCAPHDAPATTFQLESEATGDTVLLTLWPTAGVVPPATIEFDAARPVGQGAYCLGEDECQPAAWGRISLVSSGGAASVQGDWSMGLADGHTVGGTFTADWLAIQTLCG